MSTTGYRRKTFYLGLVDAQSISAIKDKYGLSTDSDAVRFALRLVAQTQVMVAKSKKSK
jgi:hypothetical protein